MFHVMFDQVLAYGRGAPINVANPAALSAKSPTPQS
jgi:hypothetical protein